VKSRLTILRHRPLHSYCRGPSPGVPCWRKDDAMGSVKSLVLAGAAAFVMIPGAFAADLAPLAPPMMPPRVQAPVEECCGSWYLRGDIGVGVIRNVKWFDQELVAANGAFVQQANADTTFIGVRVGYPW